MLKSGQDAPNFSLPGDDLEIHGLTNFRGSFLVLFFYPKDLTPGCTQEAIDFSELAHNFAEYDTKIVGISKDSLASHARFKSKHSLRTLLLSDHDLAVHKQYGAFGEKVLYGKKSMGVIRSTFLIDPSGEIVRAWYKVRVKNHAKTVLDAVRKHAT